MRQVEVWSDLNTAGDGKLRSRTSADKLGRPTKSESSEDGATYTISSDNHYSQTGKVTVTTNPMRAQAAGTNGWTRVTRDDLGRVATVETFSGIYPSTSTPTGTVTTTYNGIATTVTDQASKQRKSVVDGLGRLVKVFEDPAGSNLLTDYTYDTRGNLTQVQQGTQLARTFAYDGLSRLKQAFNPESGTILYTYDANSNLQTKTDARGVLTTYGYDGLNRVTTRIYSGAAPGPATPSVTYVYDTLGADHNGKGRLTSVSSTVSSYSYGSYDELGRLLTGTQTTDGQGYSMSYLYNLAGGMTSETYPSNRVVVTEYDSAGRIAGVKKDATTYYGGGAPGTGNAMSYTAHGAGATMRLGNGKWEHTNYNSRLQPEQIGLGASSVDSSILRLDYTYGTTTNNGNVQTQRIVIAGSLDVTQSYAYDELNRLKTANESSGANWSQTYDYDRYGNRWVSASTGYTLSSLTPTLSNHISATNNRLVMGPSHYDAAGNLDIDAQNRTFTYDAENRQITFNGTAGQYFYDGDGRRVKKIDGSGTTVFVYNAGGQLIAEYHSDPVSPPAGEGGTSYLTSDHLGSTRVVTKSDGTVKARYDYLPFGEELGSGIGGRTVGMGYSAADSTKQKFTQKERDNESGLDYFIARYYSSAQGRFTSVDPYNIVMEVQVTVDVEKSKSLLDSYLIAPQQWNRYSYVINNPLNYVDPSGEAIELLGNEEQRRVALQEIQIAVGQEAGEYLYENTIVDKNGNERYFVGISDAKDIGKSREFGEVNDAAGEIAAIVHDTSILGVEVVPYATYVKLDNGITYKLGQLGDGSPGVTGDKDGQIRAFILDPSKHSGGVLPGSWMSNGRPLAIPRGAVMAHELGHGRAFMTGDPNDNPASLHLENKALKVILGPGAPTRKKH